MRHFVLLVLVLEKALEVKLRTIFVIQISLEIENALIYTYIFLQAGLSETGLCAALAENALIVPQWIGK